MTKIALPATGPYLVTDSIWVIPQGATRREYTIPDTVLRHVVQCLSLDEPHKIGVDPMCGNGTNVCFINQVGGNCYGIELDRPTYEIARAALSQGEPLSSPGWLGQTPKIVHGDCTELTLCHKNSLPLPAFYIYTSIPFREVLNGTLGDHIAQAFDRMLLPHGSLSFMIIDSADEAVRDGAVVNPAAATVEYFERFGFRLLDRIAFRITNAPPAATINLPNLCLSGNQSWTPGNGLSQVHCLRASRRT